MVKNASKRLYILRFLKRSSVPSSDLAIYFSLVRSTWSTLTLCGIKGTLALCGMFKKGPLRIIYPNIVTMMP